MAQEVRDEEVRAQGATPGTPKFHKVKEALIAAKLNARPKKIVPEAVPEAPPPEAAPPVEPPPGQKRALRQPIVRT